MLHNFTHFFSKKIIEKYVSFVGQLWSDQVMLLDSFTLFLPLLPGRDKHFIFATVGPSVPALDGGPLLICPLDGD